METILNSKIGLDAEIECLKEIMIETGLKVGFNHEKTINISQQLDVLIFHYQRNKLGKVKKYLSSAVM